MPDEQVVEYVKDIITGNLAKRDYWQEIFFINDDKTNKTLLAHINGLIELFEKAKEILEKLEEK